MPHVRQGDIITGIDGKVIRNASDLYKVLDGSKVKQGILGRRRGWVLDGSMAKQGRTEEIGREEGGS